MLPDTWMVSERRKTTAELDVQMLRDLLRRPLSEMALPDADRKLLEELLNGRTTDETV